MLTKATGLLAGLILAAGVHADASGTEGPANFVVAWAASAQGPYPIGNATAQPDLRFAFPDPAAGAIGQTFRLIITPDIWGTQARIRLSNVFGSKPVTFDDAHVGLRQSGSAIVPGTNRSVTFGGRRSITIAPGGSAVSDPVTLTFVKAMLAGALVKDDAMLAGRQLAVSFHIAGPSGMMTWHALAMATSYISPPGSGDAAADEAEQAFPYSSTSWYFLDAVDMSAPSGTRAIVAFGDSITDGNASTINGNDRWPDVFARRMHALYGNRYAVVNAGIGGNRVIGPANYTAGPFAGGPAATQRLERDVISLSGVGAVIWLEGINDFGDVDARVEDIEDGVRDVVRRLRQTIPDVRVFMATLTPIDSRAVAANRKRQAYNQFIRGAGLFDGVIDFEAATIDAATGEFKAAYQPDSTVGGPGDKLHPNRAGHLAMGLAIDRRAVTGDPNVVTKSH